MEFSEHLKSYLSNEEIDKLMDSLKEQSLHAVLLNSKKMSDEEFLKLYPEVTKHPIVAHAYIYKKELYNLGKSIYHTLGCFYLQEPSAMVPAYLLNAEEDDVILDMCAAPGGKTIQSSFLMKGKGLIVSNDLSKPRTFSIVENIERLGIGNVVITNNDLSLIYNKYLNSFDKIILDAPCSGSGMFRKEDKMAEKLFSCANFAYFSSFVCNLNLFIYFCRKIKRHQLCHRIISNKELFSYFAAKKRHMFLYLPISSQHSEFELPN